MNAGSSGYRAATLEHSTVRCLASFLRPACLVSPFVSSHALSSQCDPSPAAHIRKRGETAESYSLLPSTPSLCRGVRAAADGGESGGAALQGA